MFMLACTYVEFTWYFGHWVNCVAMYPSVDDIKSFLAWVKAFHLDATPQEKKLY